MSNMIRSDFEAIPMDQNLDAEEIAITRQELKEIFEKFNMSGKQILNIDKGVFEKLEAYMKQVERLNEYKRKIAKQELEKYIVPKRKIEKEDGTVYRSYYRTYIDGKNRGNMYIYQYLNQSSVRYSCIDFREFKYIIAGTKYGYLCDAFSKVNEDSEEDVYIDLYLWILDRGGKIVFYQNWEGKNICRITFPKK